MKPMPLTLLERQRWLAPFACLLALLALPAQAQLSERYGPYELHYSVVNTSFLAPEIAARYQLTRGRNYAILNLAVREHLDDGSTEARAMRLQGSATDLLNKQQVLDFQEIREGSAIYYIAEFRFIDEEWLRFEVDFRPEGGTRSYRFELRKQLYEN
mgnify:CR=1 FL=1